MHGIDIAKNAKFANFMLQDNNTLGIKNLLKMQAKSPSLAPQASQ